MGRCEAVDEVFLFETQHFVATLAGMTNPELAGIHLFVGKVSLDSFFVREIGKL